MENSALNKNTYLLLKTELNFFFLKAWKRNFLQLIKGINKNTYYKHHKLLFKAFPLRLGMRQRCRLSILPWHS